MKQNKAHYICPPPYLMKSPATYNAIKKSSATFLAHLYFFFDKVGLPFGLLYMHLLSPLFYLWLLYKKKKIILFPFLCLMIPFNIIHLLSGVDLKSFLVSNILFCCTYIFTVSFYFLINNYQHTGKLFKQLLISNFVFVLIAILLFFTPYREVFWYVRKFTKSVDSLPRLAMLTYEASYYSLMWVPIASYFLMKIFLGQNKMNPRILLLFVLLPFFRSLSIGVILALSIAFMIFYLIHWQKIFYKKSFIKALFNSMITITVSLIILVLFFPDNPVFMRFQNIINGIDTSTNGRTLESFTMAYRVAKEKSLWFGAGLGQIKILAPEIVQKYYSYWGQLETVRIPNAMAETLAMFGFAGVAIRLIVVFYFFFRTQVLTNYYRTLLFIFVFIYQFTGSYLTNVVEYVIWALAFSNVFPELNVMLDSSSKNINTLDEDKNVLISIT